MMPESKFTSVRFTDIVVKNKAFVPPPGQYSNLDKAQDHIYKGASPRYKRGA
jgi:hypothetical protein